LDDGIDATIDIFTVKVMYSDVNYNFRLTSTQSSLGCYVKRWWYSWLVG
jgi:hypothetical protein